MQHSLLNPTHSASNLPLLRSGKGIWCQIPPTLGETPSPLPSSVPKQVPWKEQSEVSSKKASYLMKTCLGKSRTRTVRLGCKVHDQTSFLATQSTSQSPRPALSNPIPSNAVPMQASLKHNSSLLLKLLKAVLTKQCFPDYTLRPDTAHSRTTLPLSLPTA